jgi:transcriptional regulator with XRE-family HTH domain
MLCLTGHCKVGAADRQAPCCQNRQHAARLAGMATGERSAASVLREVRQSRGRSLRAVAAEVGIAPSFLSRVERGERHLNQELGEKMAAYYGVDTDLIELADGRVPADVLKILQRRPEILMYLRSEYGEESREVPHH